MPKKYRGPDLDDDNVFSKNVGADASALAVLPRVPTGPRDIYYDPLTPLVGPVENVTPKSKSKKEKKKKATSGALEGDQIAQNKMRRARYDTFIAHLMRTGGEMVLALAMTYGVPEDEIRDNLADYRSDMALGIGTSSVSDLLEESGLGKATRVALLKNHAFNTDPKVSLVALKIALDLEGDKHDHGTSYETYLRMVLNKG